MSHRILVTGSRGWGDHDLVRDALAVAVYQNLPAVVVHGACPSGADALASWWVRSLGRNLDITEERHPADWDHCADRCRPGHRVRRRPGDMDHPGELADYCPSAGPRRNAHMVALGADVCLAFIGPCTSRRCRKPRPHPSHGASGCADLAEKAGIDTTRYPRNAWPRPEQTDLLRAATQQ